MQQTVTRKCPPVMWICVMLADGCGNAHFKLPKKMSAHSAQKVWCQTTTHSHLFLACSMAADKYKAEDVKAYMNVKAFGRSEELRQWPCGSPLRHTLQTGSQKHAQETLPVCMLWAAWARYSWWPHQACNQAQCSANTKNTHPPSHRWRHELLVSVQQGGSEHEPTQHLWIAAFSPRLQGLFGSLKCKGFRHSPNKQLLQTWIPWRHRFAVLPFSRDDMTTKRCRKQGQLRGTSRQTQHTGGPTPQTSNENKPISDPSPHPEAIFTNCLGSDGLWIWGFQGL